jgi:uncharacterized membrane protein YoaK (UPF0700 family)
LSDGPVPPIIRTIGEFFALRRGDQLATVDFVEQHWPKMSAALVLTFASGLVDITGYLGVFHFFTAHMTGTTVQLGHGLVARSWIDVSAAASIVGAFVAGSIFGRVLIEIGARHRIRRIASVTLLIEAFLLLAIIRFSLIDGVAPYSRLAMLAGAMGLQTATLTGIGPLTVHTTFVTGMLNKIAQLFSHIAFRGYDLHRGKSHDDRARRDQHRDIQMAVFLVAIWIFYVAGAAGGTWAFGVWGISSLLGAVASLAGVFVMDQFVPLSMREEKEQSER